MLQETCPRIAPDALAPVVEYAMPSYLLGHVKDHVLENDLASLVGQERGNTALILAHIAEIESRKLFAAKAYPSMYAYCVGKLGLEDDWAYRRIQAARAARRHPAIFEMVADGRLTLTSVIILDRHLTAKNAAELLAVAAHKSKSELEQLLADRAPRPDVPAWVQELRQPPTTQCVPTNVDSKSFPAGDVTESTGLLAPERVEAPHGTSGRAPEEQSIDRASICGRSASPSRNGDPSYEFTTERPKLSPLGAARYALQATLTQCTRDKLRRAQELLGHQIPSGDLAQVLDRALDALLEKLEKRKFAKTDRPSKPNATSRRRAKVGRHIPSAVRRAVEERDHGQCTYVSASGHRCEERKRLEFDHVKEFARGGESTVANLRLRCRTHNQYTAEQAYGVGFMQEKRASGSARRRIEDRTDPGQAHAGSQPESP